MCPQAEHKQGWKAQTRNTLEHLHAHHNLQTPSWAHRLNISNACNFFCRQACHSGRHLHMCSQAEQKLISMHVLLSMYPALAIATCSLFMPTNIHRCISCSTIPLLGCNSLAIMKCVGLGLLQTTEVLLDYSFFCNSVRSLTLLTMQGPSQHAMRMPWPTCNGQQGGGRSRGILVLILLGLAIIPSHIVPWFFHRSTCLTVNPPHLYLGSCMCCLISCLVFLTWNTGGQKLASLGKS